MKIAERVRQNGKRARRSVDVCLASGLLAELEDLNDQLTKLQERRNDRLNRGRDERELAERIEALRAEMADNTVTFHLQVLPRGRFDELKAAHPPRDGNKKDADSGCNVDTFNVALLRESVVEPELDDEDWAALLDPERGLSDPQFDDLSTVAWQLNARSVSVPFSLAASRVIQTSAPESKRPEPSA